MSMSYGPGRYDRRYEEIGLDYPIEYVRWTENRNLQAFLALAASGAIDPARLDTQTVDFADAEAAYEDLAAGRRRGLAVIFRYAATPSAPRPRARSLSRAPRSRTARSASRSSARATTRRRCCCPRVARVSGRERAPDRHRHRPVGAPQRREVRLRAVRHRSARRRSPIPSVDLVFIATQHDSHARARGGGAARRQGGLAREAGRARRGAARVARARRARDRRLPRRRLQPALLAARARDPRRVRGARRADGDPRTRSPPDRRRAAPGSSIPPSAAAGSSARRATWSICAAILVGAPPTSVFARALGRDPRGRRLDRARARLRRRLDRDDRLSRQREPRPARRSASRSPRTGAPPRARTSARRGCRAASKLKTLNQDKGQAEAVKSVVEAVRSGAPSPFALDELLAVSRATLRAAESSRTGREQRLDASVADAN